MTMLDVLSELEPFGIGPNDITFSQYKEIRYLLKTRISEYLALVGSKRSEYFQYANMNYKKKRRNEADEDKNELYDVFKSDKTLEQDFVKVYNESQPHPMKELMANILKVDNGRLYYSMCQYLITDCP